MMDCFQPFQDSRERDCSEEERQQETVPPRLLDPGFTFFAFFFSRFQPSRKGLLVV